METPDEAAPEEPVPARGWICAECGERIRPGRSPGTFTHVARVTASCELDADHPAVPAAP